MPPTLTARPGLLDGATRIMTPSGETMLSELTVGDIVFTPDGRPTVVRTITSHGTQRAVRVTLKDGRHFIAGVDQIIPHTTYAKATYLRTAPVRVLATDYVYAMKNGQPGYRYHLPMHDAVEYPEVDHFIDPYALGLLLGNGALTQRTLTFSSDDEALVASLTASLELPAHVAKRTPQSFNWSLSSHTRVDAIRKELRRLDLMGRTGKQKFIPTDYLYDSINNRRALLDGLLDADGAVHISERSQKVSYTFTSPSTTVVDHTERLAWSLGYAVRKVQNDKRRVGGKLTIYTTDVLGRSERLTAPRDGKTHISHKDRVTPVIRIEDVPPRDMWHIEVDAKWFIAADFVTFCDVRGLLPETQHPFLS